MTWKKPSKLRNLHSHYVISTGSSINCETLGRLSGVSRTEAMASAASVVKMST